MSWNPNQGQVPNQGQDPNQPGVYPNQPSQYGAPMPPPTNDPYSAQQGGYQQQSEYQQPPYQQPPVYGQQQYGGYQQPYGAAASAQGPTSMGMQANTAAGLSYIAGWITGLIFFFGEKQNRFVRFNAMQSILLYASLTVLYIVLSVVATALLFTGLWGIVILLNWVVGLGGFVLWIILMINAFQGKYLKLPIIGDYAEKFATPTM